MLAKYIVVVLAMAVSVRGVAYEYYHTLNDAYDGSDASLEELRGLMDCLSDTGPCNALGADYRQYYPEVIVQACARCTPLQKMAICRLFKKAKMVLPDQYKVFKGKYDQEGIYFNKFIASLERC